MDQEKEEGPTSKTKKFKLKRANEMRRIQDFSKEELAEINKIKHIEGDKKWEKNKIYNIFEYNKFLQRFK